MPRWVAIAAIGLVSAAMSCAGNCLAQASDKDQKEQKEPESKRKVVLRVAPAYPDLARRMNLAGTVKVEAVVGNDGVVKSVGVKGGHPLLVQAATDAVRRWKWVPASHETVEPIEVRFNPDY